MEGQLCNASTHYTLREAFISISESIKKAWLWSSWRAFGGCCVTQFRYQVCGSINKEQEHVSSNEASCKNILIKSNPPSPATTLEHLSRVGGVFAVAQ